MTTTCWWLINECGTRLTKTSHYSLLRQLGANLQGSTTSARFLVCSWFYCTSFSSACVSISMIYFRNGHLVVRIIVISSKLLLFIINKWPNTITWRLMANGFMLKVGDIISLHIILSVPWLSVVQWNHPALDINLCSPFNILSRFDFLTRLDEVTCIYSVNEPFVQKAVVTWERSCGMNALINPRSCDAAQAVWNTKSNTK